MFVISDLTVDRKYSSTVRTACHSFDAQAKESKERGDVINCLNCIVILSKAVLSDRWIVSQLHFLLFKLSL